MIAAMLAIGLLFVRRLRLVQIATALEAKSGTAAFSSTSCSSACHVSAFALADRAVFIWLYRRYPRILTP